MPFTQVNAVQACTFVQSKSVSISVAKKAHCVNIGPDEESEITHTGSLHNAEILSTASPHPVRIIGTSDFLRRRLTAFGALYSAAPEQRKSRRQNESQHRLSNPSGQTPGKELTA